VLRWESGEGLRREARGSEMWFKATSASTGGRFSLMERTLPPGGRMPPAHSHVGNDEAYFVLDGTVEFHVSGEVVPGTSGTFVLVPAGEAHTFGNVSDVAARLLVLHAPRWTGTSKTWSAYGPLRRSRTETQSWPSCANTAWSPPELVDSGDGPWRQTVSASGSSQAASMKGEAVCSGSRTDRQVTSPSRFWNSLMSSAITS
jgi:mannose-6-phosphate isomerase-like protein (cupin superfamily)